MPTESRLMTAQTTTLEDAIDPFFVGVDVGGTSIKIGLVDSAGKTLAFTSFPTENEKGPEYAVNKITSSVAQITENGSISFDRIAGVGLGTPGSMDIGQGMILEPSNLPGWRHFPIQQSLQEAIGKKVTFCNDANAAAFGEYWVGEGSRYDSMIMLTLGTGVGGGIIVGDVSIDGHHSHGSELGHICVDFSDQARRCSCGKVGHLEAYASATAVIAKATVQAKKNTESSLRSILDKEGKLTGKDIASCAQGGDDTAYQIVMEAAEYMGRAIVSLLHTIDPQAVVIGGAMTFGGEGNPVGKEFLLRIKRYVEQNAFPVVAQRSVIKYALLGGDAGYLGAAGLARVAFEKQKNTPNAVV